MNNTSKAQQPTQPTHFITNIINRLLRGNRMSKIAEVVVRYAQYLGISGGMSSLSRTSLFSTPLFSPPLK